MRIAFRADASTRIGTGHVMRCLTLARALERRGARCVFIQREQPGCMARWVERQGFQVLTLPNQRTVHAHPPEEVLAPEPQKADVDETIKALDGTHIDWMVVDHYALDSEWEQAFSGGKTNCLAIDDLANRRHVADILLDQNFFLEPEHRYDQLTDSDTLCLLGPDYALINRQFQQLRAMLDAPREALHRVLVFHGGTDPDGASLTALQALTDPALSSIAVEVVIGVNNPHREALLDFAANHSNISAHEPQSSLAGLMLRADLMLGAGGTTTWERCVMRLPALVTTIAPNQRQFTRDLDEAGALVDLGPVESVTAAWISQNLKAILDDPERLRKMSTRSAEICDGWGCQRVAEFLMPSQIQPITPTKLNLDRIEFRNQQDFVIGLAEIQPDQDQSECKLSVLTDRAVPQVRIRHTVTTRLLREFFRDNAFDFFLRYPTGQVSAGDRFRITILSDANSWLNEYIPNYLQRWLDKGNAVRWISNPDELQRGDFCFILGCTQLVTAEQRTLNRHNLVVHESDLPHGRGFSPLTWQILEGRNEVPICLLEAEHQADAGKIYLKDRMVFQGTELLEELRQSQAEHSWKLCSSFIEAYPSIADQASEQSGEPTWYSRRTPADSELDIKESIAANFDLLRTVDPERYPAWFDFRGQRFTLHLRAVCDTNKPVGLKNGRSSANGKSD